MHEVYISVLLKLQDAINRELDAAQLRQRPTDEFARAAGTALGQRDVVIRHMDREV